MNKEGGWFGIDLRVEADADTELKSKISLKTHFWGLKTIITRWRYKIIHVLVSRSGIKGGHYWDMLLSLYNKTTKGYTPKGTRIAAEQNDLCHSK